MRDIRDGLIERLKAIEAERKQIDFKLKEFERREAVLRDLLAEENAKYDEVREPPLSFIDPHQIPALSDLGGFLLNAMTRRKDWHLNLLVNLVSEQGLIDENGSPGRKVHGALVSLMRKGFVEKSDRGLWALVTNKDAPPATTSGAL